MTGLEYNIWKHLGHPWEGQGSTHKYFCVVEGPILEIESGRGFFVNTQEEKRTLLEFLKISRLSLGNGRGLFINVLYSGRFIS